ncbi:MAG TPA: hypothetical protein PKW56_08685 [Clostridiales bacterium]|nr:hypothetical protein [Clostridiales bacterium]
MKKLKGFTLVDILVTALILTIAILGMVMTFVTIQRIIINNTHKMNSSIIINREFEEVQRRSFPADVVTWITTSPRTYQLPATAGGLTNYEVTLTDLGDIATLDAGTLKYIRAVVRIDGTEILRSEMLSSIQE